MSFEDVSYCPTRTTAWDGEVAISSYGEPQYADYSNVEYFQPSDAENDQKLADQNGDGHNGGIPTEDDELKMPMTAAEKKAAKKAAKKVKKADAEEVPDPSKAEEPVAVPADEWATAEKKKKSKGKKNAAEEMLTPPANGVESSKSKKKSKGKKGVADISEDEDDKKGKKSKSKKSDPDPPFEKPSLEAGEDEWDSPKSKKRDKGKKTDSEPALADDTGPQTAKSKKKIRGKKGASEPEPQVEEKEATDEVKEPSAEGLPLTAEVTSAPANEVEFEDVMTGKKDKKKSKKKASEESPPSTPTPAPTTKKEVVLEEVKTSKKDKKKKGKKSGSDEASPPSPPSPLVEDAPPAAVDEPEAQSVEEMSAPITDDKSATESVPAADPPAKAEASVNQKTHSPNSEETAPRPSDSKLSDAMEETPVPQIAENDAVIVDDAEPSTVGTEPVQKVEEPAASSDERKDSTTGNATDAQLAEKVADSAVEGSTPVADVPEPPNEANLSSEKEPPLATRESVLENTADEAALTVKTEDIAVAEDATCPMNVDETVLATVEEPEHSTTEKEVGSVPKEEVAAVSDDATPDKADDPAPPATSEVSPAAGDASSPENIEDASPPSDEQAIFKVDGLTDAVTEEERPVVVDKETSSGAENPATSSTEEQAPTTSAQEPDALEAIDTSCASNEEAAPNSGEKDPLAHEDASPIVVTEALPVTDEAAATPATPVEESTTVADEAPSDSKEEGVHVAVEEASAVMDEAPKDQLIEPILPAKTESGISAPGQEAEAKLPVPSRKDKKKRKKDKDKDKPSAADSTAPPAEPESLNKAPVTGTPLDPKAADSDLIGPAFSEATPAEATPAEIEFAETASAETTLAEAVPAEAESVEVVPVETMPAELAPAEIESAETASAETTLAEAVPAEAESAEVVPVETMPAELAPAEIESAETTLAEAVPAEAESAETASAETTFAEAVAAEAESAEVVPVEAMPAELAPAEADSAETASAETTFAEAVAAEAESAEVVPVEAMPAELAPAEAESAEVAPVEALPIEAAPAETKSAEVAPAEVAAVEAVLVEPAFPKVEAADAELAEVTPVDAAPAESITPEAALADSESLTTSAKLDTEDSSLSSKTDKKKKKKSRAVADSAPDESKFEAEPNLGVAEKATTSSKRDKKKKKDKDAGAAPVEVLTAVDPEPETSFTSKKGKKKSKSASDSKHTQEPLPSVASLEEDLPTPSKNDKNKNKGNGAIESEIADEINSAVELEAQEPEDDGIASSKKDKQKEDKAAESTPVEVVSPAKVEEPEEDWSTPSKKKSKDKDKKKDQKKDKKDKKSKADKAAVAAAVLAPAAVVAAGDLKPVDVDGRLQVADDSSEVKEENQASLPEDSLSPVAEALSASTYAPEPKESVPARDAKVTAGEEPVQLAAPDGRGAPETAEDEPPNTVSQPDGSAPKDFMADPGVLGVEIKQADVGSTIMQIQEDIPADASESTSPYDVPLDSEQSVTFEDAKNIMPAEELGSGTGAEEAVDATNTATDAQAVVEAVETAPSQDETTAIKASPELEQSRPQTAEEVEPASSEAVTEPEVNAPYPAEPANVEDAVIFQEPQPAELQKEQPPAPETIGFAQDEALEGTEKPAEDPAAATEPEPTPDSIPVSESTLEALDDTSPAAEASVGELESINKAQEVLDGAPTETPDAEPVSPDTSVVDALDQANVPEAAAQPDDDTAAIENSSEQPGTDTIQEASAPIEALPAETVLEADPSSISEVKEATICEIASSGIVNEETEVPVPAAETDSGHPLPADKAQEFVQQSSTGLADKVIESSEDTIAETADKVAEPVADASEFVNTDSVPNTETVEQTKIVLEADTSKPLEAEAPSSTVEIEDAKEYTEPTDPVEPIEQLLAVDAAEQKLELVSETEIPQDAAAANQETSEASPGSEAPKDDQTVVLAEDSPDAPAEAPVPPEGSAPAADSSNLQSNETGGGQPLTIEEMPVVMDTKESSLEGIESIKTSVPVDAGDRLDTPAADSENTPPSNDVSITEGENSTDAQNQRADPQGVSPEDHLIASEESSDEANKDEPAAESVGLGEISVQDASASDSVDMAKALVMEDDSVVESAATADEASTGPVVEDPVDDPAVVDTTTEDTVISDDTNLALDEKLHVAEERASTEPDSMEAPFETKAVHSLEGTLAIPDPTNNSEEAYIATSQESATQEAPEPVPKDDATLSDHAEAGQPIDVNDIESRDDDIEEDGGNPDEAERESSAMVVDEDFGPEVPTKSMESEGSKEPEGLAADVIEAATEIEPESAQEPVATSDLDEDAAEEVGEETLDAKLKSTPVQVETTEPSTDAGAAINEKSTDSVPEEQSNTAESVAEVASDNYAETDESGSISEEASEDPLDEVAAEELLIQESQAAEESAVDEPAVEEAAEELATDTVIDEAAEEVLPPDAESNMPQGDNKEQDTAEANIEAANAGDDEDDKGIEAEARDSAQEREPETEVEETVQATEVAGGRTVAEAESQTEETAGENFPNESEPEPSPEVASAPIPALVDKSTPQDASMLDSRQATVEGEPAEGNDRFRMNEAAMAAGAAAVVGAAGLMAARALSSNDKGDRSESQRNIDAEKPKRPIVKLVSSGTQTDITRPRTPFGLIASGSASGPQRAPTPGVVLPDPKDEPARQMSKVRSLRRQRKLSVKNAEEIVATAVILYATCDVLSPKGSPRLPPAGSPIQGYEWRDVGTDPFSLNPGRSTAAGYPVKRSRDRKMDQALRDSVADLFADDKRSVADPESPRTPRSGHHHQSSHHSSRSSRTPREDRTPRDEVSEEKRHHRRNRPDHYRSDASGYMSSPSHRPKRQDSGYSEESYSRKHRTPEEQQEHERRRAERHAARTPEEQQERDRRRAERNTARALREKERARESPTPVTTSPPVSTSDRARSKRHSHRSATREDVPPPPPPKTGFFSSSLKSRHSKPADGVDYSYGTGDIPPAPARARSTSTRTDRDLSVVPVSNESLPDRSNTTRSRHRSNRMIEEANNLQKLKKVRDKVYEERRAPAEGSGSGRSSQDYVRSNRASRDFVRPVRPSLEPSARESPAIRAASRTKGSTEQPPSEEALHRRTRFEKREQLQRRATTAGRTERDRDEVLDWEESDHVKDKKEKKGGFRAVFKKLFT